ncbi:hypothetical protein, partial [Acinetobacter stercoris]|uniref:hypothetical protein n=1 Tax=Acinetobacter stercoris TaxID=2126983 RepID=UPI001BC87C8F
MNNVTLTLQPPTQPYSPSHRSYQKCEWLQQQSSSKHPLPFQGISGYFKHSGCKSDTKFGYDIIYYCLE